MFALIKYVYTIIFKMQLLFLIYIICIFSLVTECDSGNALRLLTPHFGALNVSEKGHGNGEKRCGERKFFG